MTYTASPNPLAFATSTPSGNRPHFRVIDIRKFGVPTLEPLQAGWLLTIVTNDYWRRNVGALWFIPEHSPNQPLVVFYSQGKPYSGLWNQIIGEKCGVFAVISESVDLIQGPAGGGGTPQCKRDPLSPDHRNAPPLPSQQALNESLLVGALREMARGEHWP